MKYGIDINNTKVLNAISQELKKSGNFIVNLSQEENKNQGQALLKKVVIANITNIDFYIGIEFNRDISKCEIFYDNNEKSKKCSEMVKNIFRKNFQNITCEIGEHLYLLKNTNAPALYIKVPLEYECTIEKLYIEEIVNVLINLEI
ncbi:hypothetical protein UT300007_34480 [Clostridium sp. CTA-7]